ncbi:hypothetical protein [Pseudodesulfovibrio sp.]|uniref:hypothetical protein n=1 Tax=unclassified Pseudodesulfovibrio TaxID=2661612 RepID=UPI003AFF8892
MPEYSKLFERELVKFAQEWATKNGLNHSQFARLAYGNLPDAIGKWRRIRNISGPINRPQSLSVFDICCLAQAVQKNISELCFTVEQRLKKI